MLYLKADFVEALRHRRLRRPAHRLHVIIDLLYLFARLLYTFRLADIALPFDGFAHTVTLCFHLLYYKLLLPFHETH